MHKNRFANNPRFGWVFGWIFYFVWKDENAFVGGWGTLLVLHFFYCWIFGSFKKLLWERKYIFVIGNEREGYSKEICCIVCFIYIYIFAFVFLFASKYSFLFWWCRRLFFLFFNFLMCKWLLEGSCNTMESGYNWS